jgi:chemotaxis protein MotB
MRTLGWIFAILLILVVIGGGVYGYFHYKGLVTGRSEAQAKNAQLESELEATRKERGELEQRVASAGKDLKTSNSERDELRKRRSDAEQRLAMVKELTAKLQKMIDTGKLGVVTRQGRMIVQMPAEVLFESGKAELSKDGKQTLIEVAKVLKTDPDRRLIVAGHTDNQPIADSDFRNNWELSASRAVVVTELLIGAGLKPGNLVAAGYGQYHPVGNNKTLAGRQENRRIEIEIQPPELDALPQIVEAVSKTAAPATSGATPPPAPSASAP